MILLGGDQSDLSGRALGGKADGLLALSRSFQVPEFFVLHPESAGDHAVDDRAVAAITDALGHGPFAVRSSANVEDAAEHSYAGMFQTILGVAVSDLQPAVRQVVASASAERVSTYRHCVGGGPASNRAIVMTVIVQRMLRAERAGVCLTWRTPSSNDLLIEAVLGLGESLVSGEADPDRFLVSRDPLRVMIEHVSCQPTAKVLTPTGVEEVPVPPLDRNSPKLLEHEVCEIAAMACQVEESLGVGPCDIEWAYEGDTLYVLQARPYSALARLSA